MADAVSSDPIRWFHVCNLAGGPDPRLVVVSVEIGVPGDVAPSEFPATSRVGWDSAAVCVAVRVEFR
eukprot:9360168-Lingulodinium_polyedra.AAC.1